MGAAVTVISLLGLLVYAPLKAITCCTGTFDGERYLQCGHAVRDRSGRGLGGHALHRRTPSAEGEDERGRSLVVRQR